MSNLKTLDRCSTSVERTIFLVKNFLKVFWCYLFFKKGNEKFGYKLTKSIYVKGFKAFFAFDFCVTVLNEAHCDKGKEYEYCRVEKQHLVIYFFNKEARDDRGYYLRRHTEGIVKSREFADIASVAHLNDHRKAVYVDSSPSDAN